MYCSKTSVSSALAVASLLLHTTLAETTVAGVSQIPDGQPQATGYTVSWPSEATSLWSVSSSSYENPFTVYTTMTNSLGVITGMPAVATSQPSQPPVVTSQPVSPTLPYYSGYYYNTTSSTTLATITVSSTSSGDFSFETTASSSSNPVPTFAQATGGAAAIASSRFSGAGFALAVAAVGFCML